MHIEPKTIAFLLYPGLTVLDLIGPLEVFASAREHMAQPFRIVVAGETLDPVPTDTPVKLTPDVTLAAVPHPFGVVVPGGGKPTLEAMSNRVLTGYLREAAAGAEFVASVCTGALILAAAGLLDGRRATTHWAYAPVLEKLGATYVAERWVEDGKFITAAGVSAGIDMALHLLARLAGDEVAKRTQLGIEYEPQPPLGGLDWSLVDRAQAGEIRLQRARDAVAGDAELLRRLDARSLADARESEEGKDLGFAYQVRKSGEVEIHHRGRVAATLRGKEAADFLAKAERGFAEGQQAMARVTGNYKHGNERAARSHPRNQD